MGFEGLLNNLNKESGSRIKGYESSLDRLRALSTRYEEEALAPQKTSPWDVLSGALVQFTPALLGYGLGGRQGAITGLQAGGTAFDSFNKSLEAKNLQERELAARRYESNEKEVTRLESLLQNEIKFDRDNSLRIKRDELKSGKSETVQDRRDRAARRLFGEEEEKPISFSEVVAPTPAPTSAPQEIAVESPEYTPDTPGSDIIPYEELKDLDDAAVYLRLGEKEPIEDTPANRQAVREYFGDPKKLADYADNKRKLAYEESQRGAKEAKDEAALRNTELNIKKKAAELGDRKTLTNQQYSFEVGTGNSAVKYDIDPTKLTPEQQKDARQKIGAIRQYHTAAVEMHNAVKNTNKISRIARGSNTEQSFAALEDNLKKATANLDAVLGASEGNKYLSTFLEKAEDVVPSPGGFLSETYDFFNLQSEGIPQELFSSYLGKMNRAKQGIEGEFGQELVPSNVEGKSVAPSLKEGANLDQEQINPREAQMSYMLGQIPGFGPLAQTVYENAPNLTKETASLTMQQRATALNLDPNQAISYLRNDLGRNATLDGDRILVDGQPIQTKWYETPLSLAEVTQELVENPVEVATAGAALFPPTWVAALGTAGSGYLIEELYRANAEGYDFDPVNVLTSTGLDMVLDRIPGGLKALRAWGKEAAGKVAKVTVKNAKNGKQALSALAAKRGTTEEFAQSAQSYVSKFSKEIMENRTQATVGYLANRLGLPTEMLGDAKVRESLNALAKTPEFQFILGDKITKGGVGRALKQLNTTVGKRIGTFYSNSGVEVPVKNIFKHENIGKLFTQINDLFPVEEERIAAASALMKIQDEILQAAGVEPGRIAAARAGKEFALEQAGKILDPKTGKPIVEAKVVTETIDDLINGLGNKTFAVKDLWRTRQSWDDLTAKLIDKETRFDSGTKAKLGVANALRGVIAESVSTAAEAGNKEAQQQLLDNELYKHLIKVSDSSLDAFYKTTGNQDIKLSKILWSQIASPLRAGLEFTSKLYNFDELREAAKQMGLNIPKAMDKMQEMFGGKMPPSLGLDINKIFPNAAGSGNRLFHQSLNQDPSIHLQGDLSLPSSSQPQFLDEPLFEPEEPGGGDIGDIQDPRQLLQDTPAANLDLGQIDPNAIPQPQPQEPQVFGRDIESFGQNLDQIVGTFVPPQFQEQTMDLIESPSIEERLRGIYNIIQHAPKGSFAPSKSGFKSEITMGDRKFLVDPVDQAKYSKDLEKDLRLGKIDATYLAKQVSLFNEGAGELLPPPKPKEYRRMNLEQSPSEFGVQKKKMSTDNDPKLKSVIERVKQDPIDYAVMMMESGGKPKAKNPNSSASGLFQLINQTAKGLGVKDVFDPEENYNGYLKLKEETKRATGRDDLVTIYAGHYLGTPTLSAWLNNKPLNEKQKGHVQDFIKLVPKLRKFYNEARETINV